MELKDLIGNHYLSGVDTTTEMIKLYPWSSSAEECNTVRFILDGITYKAIENPQDGYRSYLQELVVTNEVISNIFPPQEVIGKMREDNADYSCDNVIEFFDTVTGKIVLGIGTHDFEDYYPCCIMNWSPENLAINKDRYYS